LVAVLAAALAMTACHRTQAGASSADSHAPGTTAATVAAPCAAYPAGATGVIRTFCDGPATVMLTVAGKDYALKGGTCETAAGVFSLNLGVVSGPGLAGPKPDYLGLTAPVQSGAFSNAVLTVTVDGKSHPLAVNTGQVGPAGGSFSGVALNGEMVTGSFTC
jgi:hypothetical protein